MCVEGKATVSLCGNSEEITFGETVLLPATAEKVTIKGTAQFLEVTVNG